MYRIKQLLFLSLVIFLAAPLHAQPHESGFSVDSAYRDVADQIIKEALSNKVAFDRLAYVTDTFGPRLSGSQNLEDAIDWILEEMSRDGLDHVRGEEVMVPHWVRGNESLTLLEPRRARMTMLGLGGSIGTPPVGINAEVLVVGSFDELTKHADEAEGKIVLYNVPFTSYGNTVQYRSSGAIRASEVGAVASLVRSVGSASLSTPHTGAMYYVDDVPQIPSAAITAEDAMMLQRMQDRGQRIKVHLFMEAETLPDVPSSNVVAEIVGYDKPEEVVVVGGHIDSWDTGTGAMDDAGGCVAAWEALRLIKSLGLQPRRTIRVVMWANEENGLRGGIGYRVQHMDELDDHLLAIEADAGVFKPSGFGFSGSAEALEIIEEVGRLLTWIDAGTITRGGGGADISPIMQEGVPGMSLSVDGSTYFQYHHSPADTIDKLDPHEMNLCIAALAVMTYVVADMPRRLPR